jgi:uncharacterized repeat protein (TIGR04052 family)
MRFTDRRWHARLWGLALLCVGPISACDDELESEEEQHDDDSSGSSSGGGSSRSWRRNAQLDTVAECKDACDSECGDCKADCDDEDDEDCNQRCDNDRYDCRRACEKVDPCENSCGIDCDDSCDEEPRDAGTPDAGSDPDPEPDPSEPDDEVPVTIQFEARVGTQKFACGEEYSDVGSRGTTVTPTDLRLFVQDVKLITSAGKEVPVALDVRKPWQSKQVALLDFEDGEGQCGEGNPEVNTKITGTVPKGKYTGISFSNGVPEKLNHADPTDAQDPLDEFGSLSWGWLGGFRFTKVEVREVTDADDFGCGIAHLGSTACTGDPDEGTVKCSKSNRNLVELDDFDAKSNTIVFDVAEVFEETDLTKPTECHSTGENCTSMFEAFGVDLDDGKPLSSQSVFSVE